MTKIYQKADTYYVRIALIALIWIMEAPCVSDAGQNGARNIKERVMARISKLAEVREMLQKRLAEYSWQQDEAVKAENFLHAELFKKFRETLIELRSIVKANNL